VNDLDRDLVLDLDLDIVVFVSSIEISGSISHFTIIYRSAAIETELY
jgi:hypothetical protein